MTLTRADVAVVKPVAAAVIEYVPPAVGIPTVPPVLLPPAAIVTVVDVSVAIPEVAETMVKVTVGVAGTVPQPAQPPTVMTTVNESGVLVVRRPVFTPEKTKVGVCTVTSITPPIHPGALAESWAIPGPTPVTSKQALVLPWAIAAVAGTEATA